MKIVVVAADYSLAKAWGHELFIDELRQQHHVYRVFGREANVMAAVTAYEPDFVLVQHLQFSARIKGLSDCPTPTVCLVEDFFPRHVRQKASILAQHDFDLVLFSQNDFIRTATAIRRHMDIHAEQKHAWLPFSVDRDTFFCPVDTHRRFCASFVACDHPYEYPNRREIATALASWQSTYGEVFVCLSPNPSGYERPNGILYQQEYVGLLQNSAIGIASLDRYNSCNLRHFEIPAAGAMLLTDGPPDDFACLGFIENEHYVRYSGTQEMIAKLQLYTENWMARDEIARNGQALVLERHTHAVRVKELIDTVNTHVL
jgi:hypothetical protein